MSEEEIIDLPQEEEENPFEVPTRDHQATAEEIWPYVGPNGETLEQPDFETYLHWLALIDFRRQLLAGLNMPRTFLPRPYQVEGAVHLKYGSKDPKPDVITGWEKDLVDGKPTRVGGRMIYDQPGLGKTLQASMAIATPAVISCPGYLVDQWCDFLEDQYPHWKVARVHSLLWRAQRQALLDTPHDIWVVNHEMFGSRTEPFKGGPKPKRSDYGHFSDFYKAQEEWTEKKEFHNATAKKITYHWPKIRTLVLDESHHFRRREASQSENVAYYADSADLVFLLTATPQYRDVLDWWHQLRIMAPSEFTSYRYFEQRYTFRTGWNDSIVKIRDRTAQELQDTIAKYAIGRTYNEVGLYLPPIIEKIVKVPWHPDMKKHYLELKHNLATTSDNGWSITIDPHAVLHTLRLMTATAEKVDAVKKIVEDIPGDEPIILFCWYKDTAEILEGEFADLPSSVEITGAYSQKERLRRATDITRKVKCVTMASMSEGVDWSSSNTVIFFEEDYTPGKIYQALSRVRRWTKDEAKITANNPVIVYYVHHRESVDEAVHEAVTERQGDVRRILRRALK